MLTLISLLFFKKVKSVLNMIFLKKTSHTAMWHGGRGLPKWRTAAGAWRHATRPYR
jgi:hypothetical protein